MPIQAVTPDRPLPDELARPLWSWHAAVWPTVLALGDQAVVSGGRYLATLVIGRFTGPLELGAYTLSFGWLVLFAAIVESLITLPYTVDGGRYRANERASSQGSAVALYGLFSLLASVALLVAFLLIQRLAEMPRVAAVTGVLAAVVPLALLPEFTRRMAYADLRLKGALLIDLVASILWLAGLGMLAAKGQLTAPLAYAALGLGGAAAGAVWLWLARAELRFHGPRIVANLVENWRFGRWVFGAQLTMVARAYAVPWVLAVMHGTPEVGILAAYWSVLLICNPVLLSVGNLLTPGLARAIADGRRAEVGRMILHSTVALTALVTLLCLGLAWMGETIVQVLFGGEFAGHPLLMTLLAASIPVEAIGLPSANGLNVCKRSGAGFVAGLVGLLITLVVAVFAISQWGAVGAAAGVLAGKLAASVAQCLALWTFLRYELASERAT